MDLTYPSMSTQSHRSNPADSPVPATPAPLQVIFDTILTQLKLHIDKAVVNDGARLAYVSLLHNYAILNKEAVGIVREQRDFSAIIWYERVRCGWLVLATSDAVPVSPMSFFLEGLPNNKAYPLPIFGAPVALQLPVAKCRDLTVADVRDERAKTVTKLDGMDDGSRLDGLAAQLDLLPDISSSVPRRVRIFVSRMRSVCNGVREARPRGEFAQCRNERCNRFFFCGPDSWSEARACNVIRNCYKVGETPIEVLDIPRMDPITGDEGANNYWTVCGGIPWYRDPLQRFCTSACCIEWRRQVDRCIPQCVDFDNEDNIKKIGISRIQKAYDVALRRNRELSTVLKDKPTTRAHRRAKSVRKETLDGEIDARVTLMNIDLGALYWSTIISACPENIYNRELPGDRPGWRSSRQHRELAKTLALMYSEIVADHPAQRKLITDTLRLPKFFSHIKTHAARLL